MAGKKRKSEASSGSGKSSKKSSLPKPTPKLPLSPYMLWLREESSELVKKNPTFSLQKLSFLARLQWRRVKDKKKWEKASKVLQKEYDKAMAEFREGREEAEITAYDIWVDECRPLIEQWLPDLSTILLSDRAEELWEMVEPDERSEFEQRAMIANAEEGQKNAKKTGSSKKIKKI